jgi:hypothetical protein
MFASRTKNGGIAARILAVALRDRDRLTRSNVAFWWNRDELLMCDRLAGVLPEDAGS